MTQPVIAVSPAAPVAAPVVLAASEAGEPTMEELAASMAEPEADAVVAPVVEPTAEALPVQAAEPVKEEPATAEADAALERATKAAARAREGSRRYAETQRQLSEQSAQRQHIERQAAQLRQENAAAKQREEALLKDPYKALKDRGMTDVQLAERAMRENTPEAATMRLEAALEAERNARVALENRLASEQQAAARQRVEADFVSEADNETAYPRLSQLNASVQLTVATAALRQIAANGYDVSRFSHAQVAEACEAYLAPKRAGKTTAAAPVPKPVVPKPSGKTLTNAQAQTRTVAAASWDDLSEEQQMAHLAASLVSS